MARYPFAAHALHQKLILVTRHSPQPSLCFLCGHPPPKQAVAQVSHLFPRPQPLPRLNPRTPVPDTPPVVRKQAGRLFYSFKRAAISS